MLTLYSNFHLLDYCTVHTGTVQEQVLYLRKKSRRRALNLQPPAVQQNSKTTRPPQPLIPLGVGVEVFCFNASTVQGGKQGLLKAAAPRTWCRTALEGLHARSWVPSRGCRELAHPLFWSCLYFSFWAFFVAAFVPAGGLLFSRGCVLVLFGRSGKTQANSVHHGSPIGVH